MASSSVYTKCRNSKCSKILFFKNKFSNLIIYMNRNEQNKKQFLYICKFIKGGAEDFGRVVKVESHFKWKDPKSILLLFLFYLKYFFCSFFKLSCIDDFIFFSIMRLILIQKSLANLLSKFKSKLSPHSRSFCPTSSSTSCPPISTSRKRNSSGSHFSTTSMSFSKSPSLQHPGVSLRSAALWCFGVFVLQWSV